MRLVLCFAFAFFLSTLSMPIIIKIAQRLKLFDTIDERKIHCGDIPRLGGIGIYLAFFGAIVLVPLVTNYGLNTGNRFWAILLSMFVIFALGLTDDFVNIRARFKGLVELLAATLLVAMGFHFVSITLPFGIGVVDFGAFAYPLTVLWLVGIPNALNLIDGMDGQAGGISVFTAITFGLFFIFCGDLGAALVCFALAGAVCGFLAFNLPPAKIFMGDSGALFLGFSISVLPLIGPAAGRVEVGLVPAVTLLLIPIYDTFSAIIRRTRAGVSVFEPDKLHLHHKLLGLGFSTKKALAIVYGAQAFLCLVALGRVAFPGDLGFFLNIGTWILFAGLFTFLDKAAAKKSAPARAVAATAGTYTQPTEGRAAYAKQRSALKAATSTATTTTTTTTTTMTSGAFEGEQSPSD
jgi:UDP-GlcNAc:undecaprenyl-phosphate/decaprenyl-phosphate GlcNAc-1-phosphate transferase